MPEPRPHAGASQLRATTCGGGSCQPTQISALLMRKDGWQEGVTVTGSPCEAMSSNPDGMRPWEQGSAGQALHLRRSAKKGKEREGGRTSPRGLSL